MARLIRLKACMKLITIPLREFALPSTRTGSIELHSEFSLRP
jgi:hypothetical protein